MGSWKIIETVFPRWVRISFSEMAITSTPSSSIFPPVTKPIRAGSIRMMLMAVVVFPAPVSPTRPIVSPYPRLRLSPLTA